jgi:MFS family permease
MDLTPLRQSRDFRLLLTAGTIFYFGGFMTYVAVPYQLYRLTGTNFAVGAVGLVELVPLIAFGLYGGALADHADRRSILIGCGLAQLVLTGVLAVNAFLAHPQVWLIYVVAGLLAAASALQRPSKEALLPRTVRHDQITAASALDSFGMQAGVLVGPAVGGLLIAGAGPQWCFVANCAALALATAMFVLMATYPHVGDTEPPSLRGIAEGLRYALRRRDLLGTYLVDMAAMLLAMPVVIFPALATEVFHRP